jgi:hypothetical protein
MGQSNRDLRDTWKRMGTRNTKKTARQEVLFKLTNFYFSHTDYILIGARRGMEGGRFVSGKCTYSQEQDIDWVNSSAGRSEQNKLLGTCLQDL